MLQKWKQQQQPKKIIRITYGFISTLHTFRIQNTALTNVHRIRTEQNKNDSQKLNQIKANERGKFIINDL